MKFRSQPEREQTRSTVADRLAVDLHDRHDDVGGRGDEGLARGLGLGHAERTLDELDVLALEQIDQRRAGDAAQDGVVDLAGDEAAVAVDDPGIGGGAFRDVAVLVDEPCLLGPLGARGLLGERSGKQHHRLDVAASPADVGHGLDGDAGGGAGLQPRRRHAARQAHHGRLHVRRRKQEVARPRPARHLQIDEPVADAVAPDGLAQHAAPGRPRHGLRDAQLGERAGEAGHVARLVDELPVLHFAHLVDGIAELEAAILGMDQGLRIRTIAAVDIDRARHVPVLGISLARSCELTPSARSLRCSAERSMPTNSAVREMLPPNRLIWASRYSRSKISRASRRGSDMRCSAPPLTGSGTLEPISSGSMLAVMTASGSPPDRIISRSMLFRSSRTLPGQSWACSTAMASSPMRLGASPDDWAIWPTKYWISIGMSSRRSARLGTRRGTTLRRW